MLVPDFLVGKIVEFMLSCTLLRICHSTSNLLQIFSEPGAAFMVCLVQLNWSCIKDVLKILIGLRNYDLLSVLSSSGLVKPQ